MHTVLCELFYPEGSHSFLRGIMALWVFSAAVGGMNVPDARSSPTYQWLYRFMHLLAANLDRAGLLHSSPAEIAVEPTTK